AGAWGTALAWLWGNNRRQISLWGHNSARVAHIKKTRENGDYLPGIKLPRSVDVTSKLGDCARADLIVFVTPSIVLRQIANRLQKFIDKPHALFLSCTKGIEYRTGMRMSQILREVFPGHRVAALSGPNLAVEIAQNLPTATVIGCDDVDCATSLQSVLGSSRFRIYTSQEIVSIELGGGEPLAQITASMKAVAEGIPTTQSAWECARRLKIATPIIDQVYAVLYQQTKPTVALEELLRREQKPEQL